MARYLGLDIGTTTISAVVWDSVPGRCVDRLTCPNDSTLPGKGIQDPCRILSLCQMMLDRMLAQHSPCSGIGITCQMHGILYVDELGHSISPLYTWENDLGSRPWEDGQYLLSGACLCGGRAYAALNNLFHAVPGSPDKDALYDWMEQVGRMARHIPIPTADTRFQGTRSNPEQTGYISELTLDNFTPGGLVNGILSGMCRELYDFYLLLPDALQNCAYVVAGGNAARQNSLLREHAQSVFSRPVRLAPIPEEAAAGAAKLISMLAD